MDEKKGYDMKKVEQNERNAVQVEEYGAIYTNFSKEIRYKVKNDLYVNVVSDTVNDDLFEIFIELPKNQKGEDKNLIQETAEFLAQDFSTKERENLKNLYDEMPENDQIDPGFHFWLREGESEETIYWTFRVDRWNYCTDTYS